MQHDDAPNPYDSPDALDPKWVSYCEEAKAFDDNLIDQWQRSMDVFLVVVSALNVVSLSFRPSLNLSS